MTFKEAVEFKKRHGKDTYTKDGVPFRVFVTPADPDDIKRYNSDYRVSNVTDQTATNYSSDGQFIVQGLYTDGATVIWDDLTK